MFVFSFLFNYIYCKIRAQSFALFASYTSLYICYYRSISLPLSYRLSWAYSVANTASFTKVKVKLDKIVFLRAHQFLTPPELYCLLYFLIKSKNDSTSPNSKNILLFNLTTRSLKRQDFFIFILLTLI